MSIFLYRIKINNKANSRYIVTMFSSVLFINAQHFGMLWFGLNISFAIINDLVEDLCARNSPIASIIFNWILIYLCALGMPLLLINFTAQSSCCNSDDKKSIKDNRNTGSYSAMQYDLFVEHQPPHKTKYWHKTICISIRFSKYLMFVHLWAATSTLG